MKVSVILTLATSLATALNTPSIAVQSHNGERTLQAADRPVDAPADYDTGLSAATVMRSTEGLLPLPANIQRRRESFQALRRLRRQTTTQDFYECANAVCLSFPSSFMHFHLLIPSPLLILSCLLPMLAFYPHAPASPSTIVSYKPHALLTTTPPE